MRSICSRVICVSARCVSVFVGNHFEAQFNFGQQLAADNRVNK